MEDEEDLPGDDVTPGAGGPTVEMEIEADFECVKRPKINLTLIDPRFLKPSC
jgi:hypothetical protein